MGKNHHYQVLFSKSTVAYRKLTLPLWSAVGLTPGQPRILVYLAEHDGCIQKEVAQACLLESPSITSVLNTMEKKGLVERRISPQNRRETRVFITEEGQRMVGILAGLFEQIYEICLDGFSEEEIKQYMAFCLRAHENIMRHVQQQ